MLLKMLEIYYVLMNAMFLLKLQFERDLVVVLMVCALDSDEHVSEAFHGVSAS